MRPSPSRLRKALFDILAFESRGMFLDLYSGTGAVGLEAASRGWNSTCVESNPTAMRALRSNAKRLSLEVSVIQGDALAFTRDLAHPFDVTFADPPYDSDLQAIFTTLLEQVSEDRPGILIFQHPSSLVLPNPSPTLGRGAETRHYGSNSLTLVR